MRLLVTGGYGFIGSHFVRLALRERPEITALTVLDKFTYAANLENLADVEDDPRLRTVRGDIADPESVMEAIGDGCDAIVNFAAETHVDRSILDPDAFLRTDVLGVHVLLEAVRAHGIAPFVHVSTDEVYGDVETGFSREDDALRPRSPYAASKAAADLLILAYRTTYGIDARITRGSNTYGPNQYPEKIVPLFVTNLLEGKSVPVYGDGMQIRDWLHAEDHARGILIVLERGRPGEIYNIGGGNHRHNIDLTKRLIALCDRDESAIQFVLDRPGHDRRYAIDSAKARTLGWTPRHDFETGLAQTVAWYRDHRSWWEPIKSGDFADYYRKQYAERGVR